MIGKSKIMSILVYISMINLFSHLNIKNIYFSISNHILSHKTTYKSISNLLPT